MDIKTIKINDIDNIRLGSRDIILDLRSRTDYESGHIYRAVSAPYENIDKLLRLLSDKHNIYLYCERGSTSLLTARKLVSEGYSAINLYGGIVSYRGRLVKTCCD